MFQALFYVLEIWQKKNKLPRLMEVTVSYSHQDIMGMEKNNEQIKLDVHIRQ